MKAILVIDMPNSCEECPCCYGFTCSPLDREMGIWMIKHGKLIDCPLKPMPNKKEENDDGTHFSWHSNDWWNAGWNACLEEITGETE